MILTIDIGNTTIGLGAVSWTEGVAVVRHTARLETVPSRDGAAYRSALCAALTGIGLDPRRLEGAILSSVVPCLVQPLREAVLGLLGREPVLLTIESDTGLCLDHLPEPERVGLDRIVDAAWAAACLPLPAVTVDLGTATTFNVIGIGGRFLGGVIAPGVETGLRALSSRAAQLPEVPLCTPEDAIGRTTTACMQIGAVTGAAAMIDGLTARFEAQLGTAVSLILTGGLARYVSPLCTHPHTYDPDLLTKGLALLYRRNR